MKQKYRHNEANHGKAAIPISKRVDGSAMAMKYLPGTSNFELAESNEQRNHFNLITTNRLKENAMLLSTTDTVAAKRIVKTLGMVRGNTIRVRHIGHNIMAVLRNMVGLEIVNYTKMMAEAREQAIDRMMDEARKLGANAVIQVRISTSMIKRKASEMLVCGTAVIIEDS